MIDFFFYTNTKRFACSCQKAKVLIPPNLCTLMEKDICEHILLIIAAIISDFDLQREFKQLIEIVQPFLSNSVTECQWLGDVSTQNVLC